MPKTLLLADDSVTIQKVVGISFASEDIQIVSVDNGRDAVTRARALRPDIILADVVMPGMSGYEVCEAVKADPNLRHIPVLLLTGTFEAFDEKRAAAAGAAGHVAKPFEAQTLVDRVKQLLASRPAPAPPAPPARPAAPAPAAAAPAPPAFASPPPPPPAAPPQAAQGDAFDFFSDPEPGAPARPGSADALDLDEPDAAFAFGDDDLAADLQEPAPAPPLGAGRRLDATVAILPDPPASPVRDDDALDFSFDGDDADALEEPMDPSQLGHSALLDPPAAASFDVSSSDLGAPISPGAAPTQILTPGVADALARAESFASRQVRQPEWSGEPDPTDPAEPDPFQARYPSVALPTDPVMDRLERESGEEEPLWPEEPIVDPGEPDAPAAFDGPTDPGDTIPRGAATAAPVAPTWDESESADLEASIEATPLHDEPFTAAAARGASDAPALSPALRGELHDALEKIAWDAFAQVTEKIVRHAIERVEQVAWEVVPKLAETLIQEEIRRLKGGG